MKMNIRLILTGNNNVYQLKLPFRLNKRVSGLYIFNIHVVKLSTCFSEGGCVMVTTSLSGENKDTVRLIIINMISITLNVKYS